MLRGLTTVTLYAGDLSAAADWYTEVLGVEPYFERLVSLGATVYQDLIERGPGFVTASVVDPFGNVLGVMYNQHYLDMLGA